MTSFFPILGTPEAWLLYRLGVLWTGT
jgi:hypothetical protein